MAIRIAGKIYQEIGNEIRRQDFAPFRRACSCKKRQVAIVLTMSEGRIRLAYKGVAETLLIASLLFLLIGLNSKDPNYSDLPWLYAACCSAFSAGCELVARRINKD